MADLGWFRGKRVQLIEGEIVEMAPMGSTHWVAVNSAYRAIIPLFPFDRFTVTMQCPIDLGPASEPEPDIAVIEGLPSDFADGLPTANRIRLMIEVSDSSLKFDRGRKAGVYAAAGIAEYWVLSTAKRTLEVYTDPIPVESRYVHVTIHAESESVRPTACASRSVRVRDLF